MKYPLTLLLLFAASISFAQKKIRITIYVDSVKARLDTVPGDPEQNDLVFYNKQHAANKVTLMQGLNVSPPFTVSFAASSIAQDSTIYHFNSSGQIGGLNNAQPIKLPLFVIISNNTSALTPSPGILLGAVSSTPGTGGNNRPPNPGGDSATYPQPTKSLVYDALRLANMKNGDSMIFILRYYRFGGYTGNKFLENVQSLSPHLSSDNNTGFAGNILSSISGLDVTSLADGLAKFLVKRAKQELSMAFFDRFRDTLDSPQYADLRTLFPQTYALLHSIGTDIYDYERYLQNLREGFKTDITTIYVNLPSVVKNHAAFFDKHKDWRAALLSACYVATELNNKTHPGDIIANYPTDYLDDLDSKNYKGSIQTIQLLSASLADTATAEDAPYWVSRGKVRELVNNKTALQIYLGLAYQLAKYRYDSIQFDKTNILQVLNVAAEKYNTGIQVYNAYKRYILGFGDKVDAIKSLLKQDVSSLSDSAKVVLYAKYFTSTVNLLDYSTQALDLPYIKDKVKSDTLVNALQKYFTISYKAADLVTNINARNYSSAINNTIEIYRLVTSASNSSTPVMLVNASDSAGKAEQQKMVATQNKLIYYGGFMAAMATAKTSDEVESTIETFALPAGSSRIKRDSKFNVSLNAYLGLFAGSEKIKGLDPCFQFNTWGVTAPIGVAFSWGGNRTNVKEHASSSLFFSIIDLGAVTAFRFKNDSTATVPKITLGDIISPGLFFSYGIRNTPISVNLGYQAGPLLRNVTSSANTYSNSYGRISLSFCVDIPLLNLYTKNW